MAVDVNTDETPVESYGSVRSPFAHATSTAFVAQRHSSPSMLTSPSGDDVGDGPSPSGGRNETPSSDSRSV